MSILQEVIAQPSDKNRHRKTNFKMVILHEATRSTTLLHTVISLLSCLELASSDTFHHQSSSVAEDCACRERFFVDSSPYHAVKCQNINSTERVMCAQEYLQGLFKDGSVLEIEYDHSNVDLFPLDFFSGLSIISLSFHSCNLKDIPFRLINPGCANATMLAFHNNDIATIPEGGLNCPQLQYLLLSKNNIKSISPDAFQNLGNLVALDLQRNNLVNLSNFSGLKNLEELYVSENQISYLSENAFVGYGNLKLVYLSYNNISRIQEGTFEPLTNPYVAVLLEANPFYCDCSLKWLQDWANMHNTDEPQCVVVVQGPLKDIDFCPEPLWIFHWK